MNKWKQLESLKTPFNNLGDELDGRINPNAKESFKTPFNNLGDELDGRINPNAKESF
jgi:hypothetical protein